MPQNPRDIHAVLEELTELGRPVAFLGDGVPIYGEVIRRECGVPWVSAPAGSNRQRAACVAALGAVYFLRGQTVTAGEHRPEYLRKSQAEREAEQGQAQ